METRIDHKAANNRGFTLVEVLIAMTILSIGILGIAGLAGTAIKSSGYSQAITQANNLAQEKIESLLSVDYNNVQATDTTTSNIALRRTCAQTGFDPNRPEYTCTPTSADITSLGKPFTWSYKVAYMDLDGVDGANPSIDGLKRVDVTISWTDILWHTTKSVTIVTLRSRDFIE